MLRSASEGTKLKKDFERLYFSYFDISLQSSYSFINCLYGGNNIYGPSPYTALHTSLYIRKYRAFMTLIVLIKDAAFLGFFPDLISSLTRWLCYSIVFSQQFPFRQALSPANFVNLNFIASILCFLKYLRID